MRYRISCIGPLALVGALTMAACGDDLRDRTGEAVRDEGPQPETVAEQPLVSVAEILEDPATWTGTTVTAEVQVAEVPTGRGFWIEDQGERLYTLIIDRPQGEPVDIRPDMTLRLRQAVVRDPSYLAQLPGEPLDASTEELVRSQPVFLVVEEENVDRVGIAGF